MQQYIKILRYYKIPHHSVSLSYDTATNKKVCIPPPSWQHITFPKSIYNPSQNAIIQITGNNAGIIIIDIDGEMHPTNKMLIDICMQHCLFYNKTRKGYHFFFKYNDIFAKSHNIKYLNDTSNSGIDILSNGKCAYYGTYKIGDTTISYDNIKHDAITDMPPALIKELQALITKSGKDTNKQRKTAKYPSIITKTEFPEQVNIDITTLDQLIACFPIKCFAIYDDWIRMAFIIKQSNHTTAALELFHKYSRRVPQYSNVSINTCTHHWNTVPYTPDYVFQETLYLARLYNPKLFSLIKLPWIDYDNTLYTPTTFNSQYIEYDAILPHYHANKIIAIKSPYGTGKTQFLAKLFKEENIDKILFITPRVSLSYATNQSFPDFHHYQNIHPGISITSLKKLIIQLDSIHKLNPQRKYTNSGNLSIGYNNEKLFRKLFPTTTSEANQANLSGSVASNILNNIPKYDIISLDEIESLMYHLSFKSLDTKNIFNILHTLCANAKKIIALDGDFGDRSYQFLSNFGTPSVFTNEYLPTPKHFIFTNDYETFQNELDNDLATGKNINLICMTLKASEYFYQKYKDTYNTVIHNSIQNDKQGLANINTYWKVRLVIFTSTIESGCDFNVEWFHKSYIVLSNMATTPRALMQMSHRIRHFAEPVVNIFTNGVPFYEFQIPYQFDEVRMRIATMLNKTPQELTPLEIILSYNETETLNKNYFITVLCHLLRSKGHTYEYKRISKPVIVKMRSDLHHDIADAESIHCVDDYNGIVRLIRKPNTPGKDMRTCFCMIKKYLIAKLWNLDIDTIDIKDVRMYYPKINKLLNYKFFIRFIARNTNTNLKNIKLAKKIKYIQDILSSFGIRHQEDFTFSIDCGIGTTGRKKNSKENPFLVSSDRYKAITSTFLPIIKSQDFRFIFNIGKLEEQLSDRKVLEIIKKVIYEFGFVLHVIKNFTTIYDNGNKKTVFVNNYLIDLDEPLIDLFNRKTHIYYDEIQDEELDRFIDIYNNECDIENFDSDSDEDDNTPKFSDDVVELEF
jgi:hypothetical protein